QFLRDPESPDFSPLPDWFHEAVGHAGMLASPRVARLYRLFGRTGVRASSKEGLRRLGRLYWFSAEAGVVREGGAVKAFGGAILSSVAEITAFHQCELLPFVAETVEAADYDIYRPQPRFFVAE